MSDTPAPAGANPPGANPASDAHKVDDPLPPPQQFDWIDRILILVLILVFVGLFIWFSVRNDQLYQYWSFTALLTLIFVGVLRAVGIVRTGWLALGGSVTVFVGVLWITGAAYNSNRDSAQQQKVTTLESDKVKLQSDNDALKKQITEIQTSLDGLLNQNLQIVTLDAVTSKPFTGVQFRYLLQSDGSEKIAQQDDPCRFQPLARRDQADWQLAGHVGWKNAGQTFHPRT